MIMFLLVMLIDLCLNYKSICEYRDDEFSKRIFPVIKVINESVSTFHSEKTYVSLPSSSVRMHEIKSRRANRQRIQKSLVLIS